MTRKLATDPSLPASCRSNRVRLPRSAAVALVACVTLAAANGCTEASSDGVAGSCNESATPCVVCVDYYDGYTAATAEAICATTAQNTFSARSCADAVSGCTKLDGRCKVTEANGKVSRMTYYSDGYTPASASAHCSAFNSIVGFSSEWEAE
jgi:hypothetical protein